MGFEDARMAARQRLKGILSSLAFCAWRRADVTMAAKEARRKEAVASELVLQ